MSDAIRVVDRIQDQADFDGTDLQPGQALVWDGVKFVGQTVTPSGALGEFFDQRRSADVATLPRVLAGTSVGLTAGYVYGALAVATADGSFNNLRLVTGTSVQDVEELRFGVWDDRGELLAETGDESHRITARATLYTTRLTATVAATAGASYFLGGGALGGSFSLRGAVATAPHVAPPLTRGRQGWEGGSLPALTSVGFSAAVPWVELLR